MVITFNSLLKDLYFVIVDEIHSVYQSKRGADLSLGLTRLYDISRNIIKLGLSATVYPEGQAANYLTNYEPCHRINIKALKNKNKEFTSLLPCLDYYNNPNSKQMKMKIFYNLIQEIISQYKTTLIFTKTIKDTS